MGGRTLASVRFASPRSLRGLKRVNTGTRLCFRVVSLSPKGILGRGVRQAVKDRENGCC